MAEDVVEVCNRLAVQRDAPMRIFVDNCSEFSGRIVDLWAYDPKAAIDFKRHGQPTDNCFVETINESLRDGSVNVHWFETLDEAKATVEAWRVEYKESRSHHSLREMRPTEFAVQCRTSEEVEESASTGNQRPRWSRKP